MGEVMHKVLLEAIKVTFAVDSFIAISANDVTIIDNTQCLSIHLYNGATMEEDSHSPLHGNC
jgi:hypothetical protein